VDPDHRQQDREPNTVSNDANNGLLVTDGDAVTRCSMVMKSCAAWSGSMRRIASWILRTSVSGSTDARTTSALRV
jgi:hypothetical protein